jgi:hypothetical protein
MTSQSLIQAIHKRHGMVGHNSGGAEQSRFFDSILAVFGLAADCKVSLARH